MAADQAGIDPDGFYKSVLRPLHRVFHFRGGRSPLDAGFYLKSESAHAGEQDDAEAIHQLQRHLVHILADGYRRVIDSAVEGGVVGFLQISGEIFRNRSEHVLRNIPAGGQAVDVVGIEGISVAAQSAGHEIPGFGKPAFDLFICHDFPSSREVCPDFGGISLLF